MSAVNVCVFENLGPELSLSPLQMLSIYYTKKNTLNPPSETHRLNGMCLKCTNPSFPMLKLLN